MALRVALMDFAFPNRAHVLVDECKAAVSSLSGTAGQPLALRPPAHVYAAKADTAHTSALAGRSEQVLMHDCDPTHWV